MVLLYLLFVLTAVYLYLRHVYSHWQRDGLPYIQPSIPMGNLGALARRQVSFGINIYDLYRKTTEPLVGIYLFFRPAILVRDADLSKLILVDNFNHFHDRGTLYNPAIDSVSAHLFHMPGKIWRDMRGKISPAFTSGKIKSMMPTILAETDNLVNYMNKLADNGEVVRMKKIIDRYTMNVTGSAGFGLDIDTIADPDHEFLKIDHLINSPDMWNTLRVTFAFMCPR